MDYAFFELAFPSEMMYCRCVEALVACSMDVGKANKVLNIDDSCVETIERYALKVKDRLEIYGNFSLVRQKMSYKFPRYAESYVMNRVMYNMRITPETNSDFRLELAFNKWSGKKNNLNIGSYCSTSKFIKRGGGHYNVGGGVIEKSRLDDFLDSFSILVEDR